MRNEPQAVTAWFSCLRFCVYVGQVGQLVATSLLAVSRISKLTLLIISTRESTPKNTNYLFVRSICCNPCILHCCKTSIMNRNYYSLCKHCCLILASTSTDCLNTRGIIPSQDRMLDSLEMQMHKSCISEHKGHTTYSGDIDCRSNKVVNFVKANPSINYPTQVLFKKYS